MTAGRTKHAEFEKQIKEKIYPEALLKIFQAWNCSSGYFESEKGIELNYKGHVMTGRPDMYSTEGQAVNIIDFKFSMSDFNVKYYEQSFLQLMVYGWLAAEKEAEKGAEKIDKIRACFLFPEFEKWIEFEWNYEDVKQIVETLFDEIIDNVAQEKYTCNFLHCKNCLYENCDKFALESKDIIIPDISALTPATVGRIYEKIKLAETLAEQAAKMKDIIKQSMRDGLLPAEFEIGNTIIRLKEQKGKRSLDSAVIDFLSEKVDKTELLTYCKIGLKEAETVSGAYQIDISDYIKQGEPEYRLTEIKKAEVI